MGEQRTFLIVLVELAFCTVGSNLLYEAEFGFEFAFLGEMNHGSAEREKCKNFLFNV